MALSQPQTQIEGCERKLPTPLAVAPRDLWDAACERRMPGKQTMANAVRGALTTYGLPDLAATLRGGLTIEQPADPMGQPIKTDP